MAQVNGSTEAILASGIIPSLLSSAKIAIEGRVLITILAASLIAMVSGALFLLRTPHDPREPVVLKPRIPIIGHAIGLLASLSTDSSGFYYKKYQANPEAPILTLPLPGGRRIYVIQNTQLMQAALRHKNLSFDPFVKELLAGMLRLSKETEKKVMKGTESGLMTTMTQVIQRSLAGENLRTTSGRILDKIAGTLNNMEEIRQKAGAKAIQLDSFWAWMRQTLAYATLVSLYGDKSPFSVDETLMDAIWTWDYHLSHILLTPPFLESLVCPKGYSARAALQKGFTEYFQGGYATHPSVSPMVKQRALTLWKYGWTPEDAGSVEQMLAAGSVQNATPAILWLFLAIIRRPEHLQRIQDEIRGLTTVTDGENGKKTATLDIGSVETLAPFLVACYHENIRLHKRIVNTRRTMCDTELGGFLLKAGSDVMMSVEVASNHRDVWGQNTGDPRIFDPSHFLALDTSTMPEEEKKEYEEVKKARKDAWIPFGGGKHLCPGRNLAFAEILGFTAALLLGYEFDWDNEKGEIPDVKPMSARIPTDIPIPDEKGNPRCTAVKIKRKKEWEGVIWAFKV